MALISFGFVRRWTLTSALALGAAYGAGACGSDTTIPRLKRNSDAGEAGSPELGTGGTAGRGGTTARGGTTSTGGTAGRGGTMGHAGTTGHTGKGGGKASGGTTSTGGDGGSLSGGDAGAGPSEAGAGGELGGEGGNPPSGVGGSSGGAGNASSASGGVAGTTGGAGSGGAACDDNVTVLASTPEAWALAVDAGYVYFTSNAQHGAVLRVPAGGGPIDTISSAELFPHEIAVANGLVFWVALGTEAGHVVQATVTGADRHELLTDPPANSTEPEVTAGIFFLAADATNVYYTSNLNDLYASSLTTDADPLALSLGPYNSLIVDAKLRGSNVFWTNNGVSAFQTPTAETATVKRASVDGVSAAVTLESRLDYPQFAIAVDDEHVFWNDESAIYSTSLDGGAFQSVVTLPAVPPDESPVVTMLSDGTTLFYTDGTSIYGVPVDGGTQAVVTSGWTSIEHLALTPSGIVFTDSKRGVVASVAKCAKATGLGNGAGGAGGQGTGGAPAAQGGAGQGGTASGGASSQGGSAGTGGSADCGGSAGSGNHGCPAPVQVATVSHAYGLAIDETYLYVSQYATSGAILRVPIAGGDPEPVISGQYGAYDIAVDGENVYYCLADSSAGHLLSVPKTGGSATPLATGSGQAGLGRVASDGVFAYYTTAFNSVYRIHKDSGHPALIAAGPYGSNVQDLAVDGTDVYWVNDGMWNSDFSAKLPGTAYVATTPVSGRADLGRHTLATGLSSPLMRVAVDATNVYFVDGTSIYRRAKAGGPAVVVGATAPASGSIGDMLADGTYVYFADKTTLYRMPVTGGPAEPLSGGWGHIETLAVDATNVYFTDNVGGVLMKRPK